MRLSLQPALPLPRPAALLGARAPAQEGVSATRACCAVQMTGARLTSTRFAVQVSGASPFWCAKATRKRAARAGPTRYSAAGAASFDPYARVEPKPAAGARPAAGAGGLGDGVPQCNSPMILNHLTSPD